MDNEMLEQLQQMITTANEGLRQNLRQDMAALESNLGVRMQGIEQAQRDMESTLGGRMEGIEQAQQSMQSTLAERMLSIEQAQRDMQSNLGVRVQGIEQAQRGMESRLGGRMQGIEQAQGNMESTLGERMLGIEQAQRDTESRLGDRIEETKRHSGILVEDLHHKLDLVIEGQQFIRQDVANVRSDMDAQTRDTRSLIGAAYRDLSQRLDQHEQRHHS